MEEHSKEGVGKDNWGFYLRIQRYKKSVKDKVFFSIQGIVFLSTNNVTPLKAK
jgi:hypothetical protein